MDFSLIAAVDKNFGIGKNNTLPWSLPSDLKHFAKITTDVGPGAPWGTINAVIMGRKTWESLPEKHRPLKHRLNLVLSRHSDLQLLEGILVAHSIDEALKKLATHKNLESLFVIGGAQIFAEAINHPACHKIYLTQIMQTFDCDTFFPKIDPEKFSITEKSPLMKEGELEFQFMTYSKA